MSSEDPTVGQDEEQTVESTEATPADVTPAEGPAAKKPRARRTRKSAAAASDAEPKAAREAPVEQPAETVAAPAAEGPPDAVAEEPVEAPAETGDEPAPAPKRTPIRRRATTTTTESKPAKPVKAASAPRRSPAPTVGGVTVVRAQAKYVRTSARKARMVCGHLRGKPVEEARAILAFTPRDVARVWSKLLESAVANAENNHELVGDDLIVRDAYADEGPTLKRFRPRAMGRATPIRKRTSHLTITLTPRS
jgi:ribosomal protein L22